MTQNASPRIAVAGCGHWGKNLVRNFSEIGALSAICDNNPKTAQQFANQYNVPAYDWDALVQNPDIDAIALASPAPYHYHMAKAALENGKDIFVEKPITLENEHAEELVKLAKDKNAILMVGHLLHYHPAYLKLQKMVKDGAIGNLLYAYSNRIGFGKIRREENVLWSFAPHDISMILGLTNGKMPKTISASGHAQTHDTIKDVAHIQMKFENDFAAHIHVSWINPFKEHKFVAIGTKGALIFDDREDWPQKLAHSKNEIELSTEMPTLTPADAEYIPLPQSEPLKNECQHFIDCIQTRTTPRTDGEEGLRVLEILNKADKDMYT